MIDIPIIDTHVHISARVAFGGDWPVVTLFHDNAAAFYRV